MKPEWEKECWLVALAKVTGRDEAEIKAAAQKNGWDGKSFGLSVAATISTLWSIRGSKPKMDISVRGKTPKSISFASKTGLLFTAAHVMPIINGVVSNFNGYGDDPIILLTTI